MCTFVFQLVTRPALQQGQQRIILPATSQVSLRPNQAGNTLAQIRPAGGGAATLTQLPPGTTIISSGQNLSGVQGFALVPAQYVTQVSSKLKEDIFPYNVASHDPVPGSVYRDQP